MSAKGALRCGAGLVELLVPKDIYVPVASKLDECMVYPLESTENGAIAYSNLDMIAKMSEKAAAVLIGCGISRDEETSKLVRDLIFRINCPIILDADGLNAFEGHINLLRTSQKELILTPHPGEMSRLCSKPISEIQSSRIETAREFAKENDVTLVLKGAFTVIAAKSGKVYVNPTGNPGMAKGGSGDILAGMTAAFVAQKFSAENAACCAVYIHGSAGDRAAQNFSQYSMIPTDILNEVPQIFLEMSR
jgi:NAD(P)H-hydrate epimerase